MGKVNVCFKFVFISFNALFHVFGWLAFIGALTTGSTRHMPGEFTILVWLAIIGTICISALGIYGSYRENTLALKIFAGCVGVGMVVTLIFGIITVDQRRQVGNSHGVLFGLFAAAVMSLVMSIIMIYGVTS